MGFGPFSGGDKTNTNQQFDQRVLGQVSDQGVLGQGDAQIGGALDQSASGGAVNNQGQYASTGGVSNSGVYANTGSKLDYNVVNNNVDAAVIGAYGDNLRNVLETQASADSIRDVAQQNFLTGITGSLAKLSDAKLSTDANAASGGDIQRNRIVLYIGLGLLAVVAFIFWRK